MKNKKERMHKSKVRFCLLSLMLFVTAVNCGKKVSFSELQTPPPVANPALSAPDNVDAIQGNKQVTISWANVVGATSYTIYWSTLSGVNITNGTKITNVTNPYTQTGLQNGTTYYYIVTAENSYGESSASNQVSATPLLYGIPPAAPTGVSAAPGNGQVILSWNPIQNATSYNIYWSTSSNVTPANGTKISSVTNPYTHSGLSNGTTYFYVVTALNSYGESTGSSEVSATPSMTQTGVVTTLPWEGAKLIPLNSTMIVKFSNQLNPSTTGAIVTLSSVSSGSTVTGQTSIQSSYLFFTPSTTLSQLSVYRFTLSGSLFNTNGLQVILPAQGLSFSFETEGQDIPLPASAPTLLNVFPSLRGEVFTNAVFRLTFSQPLSQASLVYGNDIKITDTTANTVVSVKLIPINNTVVLQPVSGLIAGHVYSLILTNGILGLDLQPVSLYYAGSGNGSTLSLPFIPVSAGRQALLNVELSPSVSLDNDGNILSMNNVNASGIPMNANIVNSKLIGTSIAYLTGYLENSMGDISMYPSLVPIIIPGGQRLYGSTMNVELGGVIPTGLASKKLSITLLDNATMFIGANPYQPINPQAPATIYGIQDLNLTAQDPVTNAVLNQNLMGVQLTGTVTADTTTGSLVINLVGITELNIMGIEKAPLILFLRLQSVPAGWVPPQRDNTFVATGTIPYSGDGRIGTDSSFIVDFSGPVDPDNYTNMLTVNPAGSLGYQTTYNGSSIIVTPYTASNPLNPIPLVPKTPYSLTVSSGLASVMGTTTNQNAVFNFTTDALESGGGSTPVIATVFPENNGYLPLFAHPYISLNQFINPSSVVYNSNVFVRDVSAGNSLVAGGVKVTGKKILFIPSQQIVNGHQYTFTVNSSVADIDGNTLGQGTTIHFTAEATPWFPILSQVLSPVADRNQNTSIDGSEITTPTNEIYMGQTTLMGLVQLVPQSPSYLSGSINALVTGITTVNGQPRMQFVVDDGAVLFGTNVNIVAAGLISLSTGMLTLSLSPLSASQAQGWPCGTRPACGYIAYNTSAQQLTAVTYMASTATASNGVTEAMMSPYQPVFVALSGPVTFLPDGRLALTMSGKTTMTVGLLGITANIPTTIYTRIVSAMPSMWN